MSTLEYDTITQLSGATAMKKDNSYILTA